VSTATGAGPAARHKWPRTKTSGGLPIHPPAGQSQPTRQVAKAPRKKRRTVRVRKEKVAKDVVAAIAFRRVWKIAFVPRRMDVLPLQSVTQSRSPNRAPSAVEEFHGCIGKWSTLKGNRARKLGPPDMHDSRMACRNNWDQPKSERKQRQHSQAISTQDDDTRPTTSEAGEEQAYDGQEDQVMMAAAPARCPDQTRKTNPTEWRSATTAEFAESPGVARAAAAVRGPRENQRPGLTNQSSNRHGATVGAEFRPGFVRRDCRGALGRAENSGQIPNTNAACDAELLVVGYVRFAVSSRLVGIDFYRSVRA